jgi:acyl-CoA thioesterase FadM
MEAAFDEFLRSKGCGYRELADGTGSEVCHKKSTYEYFSSAFEGDLLEVGVRVIRIGEKSFTLGFEVYRQGEDDLLVTGEIVFCGYDPELRRSRPITEAMRKLLSV